VSRESRVATMVEIPRPLRPAARRAWSSTARAFLCVASAIVVAGRGASTSLRASDSRASSRIIDIGAQTETVETIRSGEVRRRAIREMEPIRIERHEGRVDGGRFRSRGAETESDYSGDGGGVRLPGGVAATGAGSDLAASTIAGGVTVFHGAAVILVLGAGVMAWRRRFRMAAIAVMLAGVSVGLGYMATAGPWLWVPLLGATALGVGAWCWSEIQRDRAEASDTP